MTTKTTAALALALHADDGGSGSSLPLVFLHSSAGDTTHFRSQLAHARRCRRAIALDLRGHGRSPACTSFDVDAAARDVVATLDRLGVGRFVVVGHSWGGAVATAVAGSEPSRVAGLLLLDPATDGRLIPKDVADGLLRSLDTDYDAVVRDYWGSMLIDAKADVRERIMNDVAATPSTVVKGTLASLLEFDPVTPLTRYTGPKRTIVTRLGLGADAYQNRVPDLSTVRIEGTGHWLHLDAPAVVDAEIDAFMRAVEA